MNLTLGGMEMTGVEGFNLKKIMWERPQEATVKDDIRTLIRERLIVIGLFNELVLFHQDTDVEKWSKEIQGPMIKRLKELNRAFNATNPDQFHRLSVLNAEAVDLLNKEIPNVYWLSNATTEKQDELWGKKPAAWEFLQGCAATAFEDYAKVGKKL